MPRQCSRNNQEITALLPPKLLAAAFVPFFAHYPRYSAVRVGEIFRGHIACICNISGGLQRVLARQWMITVYGRVKMCLRPLVRTKYVFSPSALGL